MLILLLPNAFSMKKIFFATLIFFAATDLTHAQVDVINASLIIPDSNTAFVGVQNIFEIVNADKGTYTLLANSSSIEASQKLNSFIVKPHFAGADTFQVIKNGKTVYSKIFKYSYLPMPDIMLGSLDKKEASREEIVANKALLIKKYNCKYLESWKVISFVLKTKSNTIKQEDTAIAINGNLLSDKANAFIQSLAKNDVVTFDDIHVMSGDGRTVILHPFSINIK